MSINHNKTDNKWEQLSYKIYKMCYLKDFCVKNAFERFTSWLYNICFMLICLVGLIPIIEAIVASSTTSTSFGHEQYFISIFILSFFFLFDLVVRIICAKYYYNTDTYLHGLKALSISLFAYFQLFTWITTFSLMITLGQFSASGIVIINEDAHSAVSVTTSLMFLINSFIAYKRFFLYSHNMSDLEMFTNLVKQKRKFWMSSIVVVVFVILIFSFAIYVFEVRVPANEQSKDHIKTIWDALFFSLTTVTTVGFGVNMPVTVPAKVFVVILMITGIYLYAFLSSQFINVFNEFFAKKKEISKEATQAKEKEVEQEYLLQKIDELILINMYKAKLITKKRFDQLMKEKVKTNNLANNRFKESDFSFDKENKTIYYCGAALGNYITDPEKEIKAYDKQWSVVSKKDNHKNIKPTTALYFLTTKVATNLAHNKEKIQIIFTSKQIDKNLNKLIVYEKKPYVSTICEFDIAATLVEDKNKMWDKFGAYTNLSKEKFNSLFKNQKHVTAIFLKNIILYDRPKQIESYGIANTTNMKEIIPLL